MLCSKILNVIFAFLLLIVIASSCFSSIKRYRYTGLRYTEGCLNECGNIQNSISIRDKTYRRYNSICVSDIMVSSFVKPSVSRNDRDIKAFIDSFVENTSVLIKRKNHTCLVPISVAQRLTKYYFIKSLKMMQAEKKVILIDDFLYLSDLVCTRDFDNTDSLTLAFGDNRFGIVFLNSSIVNKRLIHSIKYYIHLNVFE